MNKTVIALTLALSTAALAGCSIFHSDKKPWEQAKQERPLEIPSSMDRPSVSEALVIPTVNAQHQTAQAPANAVNATILHLDSGVDKAYKRVGLALGNGDMGSITAQSEADHTYQVAMKSKLDIGSNTGFLQRHFSNTQSSPDASGASSSSSGDKPAVIVTLRVEPAAGGGSTVSAQGDPQQAARLISTLKARLGG
jgi:uncharacterized lipoprotein